MLRSSLTTMGIVLLGTTALAQSDLSSQVHPITSPVKNAGTFHLATGTWTRAHAGGQALLGIPESIVYANTCTSGYYGGQDASGLETWTDEGEIPNPDKVKVMNVNPALGADEDAGCAYTYNITGFQVAYCSYQLVFTANVNFYDLYEPSGVFCTVPGAPTASFALTGLPSTPTVNVQGCWLVAFDIDGAGNFTLTGGDRLVTSAPSLFGWSFNTSSLGNAVNPDGPIIAGNLLVCTGTDATRWDRRSPLAYPANYTPNGLGGVLPLSGEEGTGMNTLDAFRIDGTTTAPAGPGCYYFGGNPLASFHLELYSDVDPCDILRGTPFCFGDGTGAPCPCAPGLAGHGCESENPDSTGGALLEITGSASVTQDASDFPNEALTLHMTNASPFKSSLFFQGTVQIAPVTFGDGLRCVGGSLIRLNGAPPAGDPTDGGGALDYPNSVHPRSITNRCADVFQPIFAGDTRHYFVQYRDPFNFPPAGNCPGSTLDGTRNTSNAVEIVWQL